MRTAKTVADAAIVIAATEDAPTADGSQTSSPGAATDATDALAKPLLGASAATDNAVAVN